jgi:hypothetical protein
VRRGDAIFRLVKDRDRRGCAVPGVYFDIERSGDGVGASMVGAMNDENSWQLLLVTLFLFLMLMTPVILWWLGYD